jgi:hypothetical protein
VQKELGLSDKQKTQIRKLEAQFAQKQRQAFEKAQEGDFDPRKMMTAMGALEIEQQEAIAKILDAKQKERLSQIELQRDGLLAVAKPAVAKKLKLTSSQSEKVNAIVEEMRQAEQKLRPGPPGGPGFPGGGPPPGGGPEGFPGGGPPPGDGPGGFPGGGPPPGGDQEGFPGGGPPPGAGQADFPGGGPPPGGPDFNSEGFRAQMARMRQEREQVRKAALDGISAVLTKDQKAGFDKMLGKPFDLAQIRPGPGNPPRGARPGATSRGTSRQRTRRNAAPPPDGDEPQ